MATLHIEHPVTDFGTWQAAFDRFAQVRQESGVCGQRILRPVDDAHYVVIDLDFPTAAQAPTRSSTSSEKTAPSATPSRCCAPGARTTWWVTAAP